MIWENILIYFVVIPVLTLAGLAICKNIKQVRAVSIVGASALMVLGVYVLIEFLQLRAAGNVEEMLFRGDWSWFEPLNIKLSLGVDGISVAMLLLSCVIVFAGVFAGIIPTVKNIPTAMDVYQGKTEIQYTMKDSK